jgi:hypothetical protein
VQIGPANIVLYGMQAATTPANATARAALPVTPIAAIKRDEARADAWIDASWTEAPARPAQIDPYDTDLGSAAAFAAQRYVQEDGAAPESSLHHRGIEAYQTAQGAGGQYQRGDLGIDLIV